MSDPAREPQQGTVLRDEGSFVIVDLGGEEVACAIRKTLRRRKGKRGKAVVVGDRVTVEFSGDGAAVADVAARAATISRRDPSQPRREQVLVANVDAVLVVASAAQPDLTPRLIDRFLVAAESRGIGAAVAINKIDLDPDRAYEEIAAVYLELGYEVFACSAATGEGLDAVRSFLAGKTTAMFGHSGVGKSTLANALDPSLELRTGEVHGATGKGMHTTTTVSLLRLPWGGYLVDTPGIREFGLWRMEFADLGIWFREIAERTDACRFNDCVHESEPGCAVKAGVEAGAIARWRYESYLSILESLRADTLPDY